MVGYTLLALSMLALGAALTIVFRAVERRVDALLAQTRRDDATITSRCMIRKGAWECPGVAQVVEGNLVLIGLLEKNRLSIPLSSVSLLKETWWWGRGKRFGRRAFHLDTPHTGNLILAVNDPDPWRELLESHELSAAVAQPGIDHDTTAPPAGASHLAPKHGMLAGGPPSSATDFVEVQRFCQKWLWIPLLAIAVITLGNIAYGGYKERVLGELWSHHRLSESEWVFVLVVGIGAALGPVLLLAVAKLVTRVGPGSLTVRFFPFHLRPRVIHLGDVVKVEATTYSPLREYGGWGIRCGRGGKAYNVSGNQGVRLTFADGRHLLIGSQQAHELAAAIEAAR